MHRDRLIKVVLLATLVVFSASHAYAEEFFARLNGFQEIGAQNAESGAILTNGTGTLRLDLDRKNNMATWTLTFQDVGVTPPKTGTVTQAHIHFGKRHVAGGVMVFFCTNLNNGPAGTQPCPMGPSGTVSGAFNAASVVGPTGQNVSANDFNALVEALTSNTAYANIHTTAFPAGEIRGQVHRGQGDNDDRNDNGNDRD